MNKLILLRHGQSQWNRENKFTGLQDVPLTNEGIQEARKAGEILIKNNVEIDIVFSSKLQRANKTAEIALKFANFNHLWSGKNLIMIKNESLNERDYGDLVGLNKKETAEKFGKDQVHIWRRSYETSPPNGESLKDVVNRVSPFFRNFIKPKILENKNVLIVAHGNSLRATMIEIGLYKPNKISEIEIPTGSPFCINFKENKFSNSFYFK